MQKEGDIVEKISMNDIRKKNYSDVYSLIYEERRISKSKIAAMLEMSPPTVTQHLTSLMKEGLIEKQGQMTSGIGRKAVAYAPCAAARIAIGVEVLPERVCVAALNLYGDMIEKKEAPLIFSQEDSYFSELSQIILEILQSAHIENSSVLGVGIGIQGLVSEDGQKMLYGKILDCTGLTIHSLQEKLPCPVRFIHDAECAAELELWRNPKLTDAIYLSLGAHLGGAIITQGKIQRGRTGRTGTVEHMTLVPDDRQCYCGKRGCMECYCSANALLKPEEQLSDFFNLLRQGDDKHTVRWMEYLDYLAMALNNLHMVLDCTIVLGGHIAPYLNQKDLDILFSKIQTRTAFPDQENFLLLGVPENYAVASGAAIPFIRSFLTSI